MSGSRDNDQMYSWSLSGASLIFNFFWAKCAFLAHVVLGGVSRPGDQSEDTHSDLRLLSRTPAFPCPDQRQDHTQIQNCAPHAFQCRRGPEAAGDGDLLSMYSPGGQLQWPRLCDRPQEQPQGVG